MQRRNLELIPSQHPIRVIFSLYKNRIDFLVVADTDAEHEDALERVHALLQKKATKPRRRAA